jgi:hypothetical protein
MRRYFLGILSLFFSVCSFSQNIPNGGFESIVENEAYFDYPYPQSWVPRAFWNGQVWCEGEQLQGSLSEESHSGMFSIRMETIACDDFYLGFSHIEGGFITGNPALAFTGSPYHYAIGFSERPSELNFFYKFEPEGNDSAFVGITLFNYDSVSTDIMWYERRDTIGYARGYITQPTSQFIEYTLPIEYLSDSIPSFMTLGFQTGLGCNLTSCTPGTTLWVDDVSVSGGTLGLDDRNVGNGNTVLYPNPTMDSFRIDSGRALEIVRVSIFTHLNEEIKRWEYPEDSYKVSELRTGTYFVRIESLKGIIVKKLIIIK